MVEKILAVADPHLGTQPDDIKHMRRFVNEVDPESTELVFLGDLFHIWAGPGKYHTPEVVGFLDSLWRFKKSGGKSHLVVGNRDIFLTEFPNTRQKSSHLPFDSVSREFAFFHLNNKTLVAIHGDTVNTKDKSYLRWRKLIRHPLFEALLNLFPPALIKTLMIHLEKSLKKTGAKFRKEFPATEWEAFIKQVQEKYAPDLLMIGHFHPEKPIVSENKSHRSIVVPDWHKDRSYIEINSDLNPRHLRYR